MEEVYYINLKTQVVSVWPQEVLQLPDLEALSSVWLKPATSEFNEEGSELYFNTGILFEETLTINFGLIDGLSLTLGTADLTLEIPIAMTITDLTETTIPHLEFQVGPVPITFSLDNGFFTPAERVGVNDDFVPNAEESMNIELEGVVLNADLSGNLELSFDSEFSISPVFIGKTGVVVEASGVTLYLSKNSNPPSGFSEGFQGLYFGSANIYLPNDLISFVPNGIEITECAIGSGGFSGSVSLDWETDHNIIEYDEAEAKSFLGFSFTLQKLEIEFIQNTLVGSSIIGFLKLPFFDEAVQVELGLTNDGDFTIALANQDGLLTLEKEDIISIDVTSLEFIKEDTTFSIKLSGKITPLLAGLDWPSFELKGLTIGSDGSVKVDGGWLALPDQKALDFHGFQIEIAQLGFGSDEIDGVLYKWVGFSGGIQIVQALPMRGGVEGLKVMWDEDNNFKLKIGGVYLAFEIKDVLTFDGSVFFIDEDDKKEFRGSVDLNLIPINLGIDAQFITGKTNDYNYFYIAVDLDLPIGIPLGPPVLGLYGLAGLYGHNMTLDYNSLIDYEGVENRPELTDVDQWFNQKGAMAFGAGLTVGTLPDSKFTVKAKALFVILIPGPVLLIEGHAGMLSLNDSYMMQVLAVLDPTTGTFLLNISAGYRFPKANGELLDISGSAEAYFTTANPSSWHLYLGENKPESKRIRADIYSFFKAQTYLMVDNDGLSMGAWIGYGLDKKYGILRVVLEAWISGELSISTMPLQAKGKVSLYGNAELSAKLVKLGISVEADVTVQAPKPVAIDASLKVQLKTGVGKLKATINLNWAKPAVPTYPLPLSATLGIEHRKVAQNWDIQKNSAYLVDDDGLYPGNYSGNTSLSNIPVVPPDVYMVLNFDKPVNDIGLVGSNPALITKDEKVGDFKFKYELLGVSLEYRNTWDETDDNGNWYKYSDFAATLVDQDLSEYQLSGSWQAMPDEDEMVNTKLVLNASTPFEISRLLEEKEMWYGLLDVYNPNYPCTDTPELVTLCADFEDRVRMYYYGVIAQEGYLFSSPYPMIVRGYEAPWLGTSNALMNADNYVTTVCLNIKAQEETEAFQLKIIEDVIFTAGIGYDAYLKLTDEYSNEDVELYVSDSQLDLDNQIIPAFIHFPKISFENIPDEVWITCIIKDNTIFYAFDEDGNVLDTHSVNKSNTIVEFKLSSSGSPIRKIGMLGNAIRILDICYKVFHPVETMSILVTAPEDIITADIHFSKNSNGVIYVYDEDSTEVQQIPFDISGSLADDEVMPIVIETQSNDPFRSFLVTGWFDIIRVCGVTQEAQDIYNYNANLETHLQESLEENWGKHTEQILYPNKYYRLKIDTATSRKKDNGSWEPQEFTEYIYFKTGNPPGPPASTQVEVGSEPKDRYDLDGPLRDLTPYVDYTIPAGAIAGEEQARVYRSYDIGVAYNDSYIDQMYQMAGLPLKIRLLDNNNLPITNAAGDILEFDNSWGDNPVLSLTTEETTYKDILDESGCITMISQDVETNVMNIAPSRELLLNPQTQYRAQVVAGEDTSIFEFAFISSRYSNFIHHIHSFEDAVWNHFELRNDPAYSVDAVALEQILNNGEEEQVQFGQLMEHFDLNPRMTPDRLEITLINDANTSYGLLIESPEPIDGERTELRLAHSMENTIIEPHDGKVKIVGGTLAPSQWADILILESTDMSGWVIEYRELTSTDEADYQPYFEFPTSDTYYDGNRIRVHNGEKPMLTLSDTEHVYLYAGHTTDVLPADGAQIRIKNSHGEVLHQRIIHGASTAFSQKDITIIRKDDESKWFVFVNDGSQLFTALETGQYKLDFTYHRDIGEDHTKLTRFGKVDDEEATIAFSLP